MPDNWVTASAKQKVLFGVPDMQWLVTRFLEHAQNVYNNLLNANILLQSSLETVNKLVRYIISILAENSNKMAELFYFTSDYCTVPGKNIIISRKQTTRASRH